GSGLTTARARVPWKGAPRLVRPGARQVPIFEFRFSSFELRELVMAFGVLAAGEAVPGDLPGPAEFPHPNLGRVIGAADPPFHVLEVVAQRDAALAGVLRGDGEPRPVSRTLGLAGLLGRGRGEDLVLLLFGQVLEGMLVAIERFALEGR